MELRKKIVKESEGLIAVRGDGLAESIIMNSRNWDEKT
jgi:hypothetical protein